jgi:diguanylate cyclase (GGDEF)-like protein
MTSLRVLLVDGEREITDGVERALRRDLSGSTRIVRTRHPPKRGERFDVAVVVLESGDQVVQPISCVPTLVVGPKADPVSACSGIEHALSAACATCAREPLLASAVMWTIENARRARALEQGRQRELRLALHDPLTGLASMHLWRDRLHHSLARARRTEEHVAALFMDLDNFKAVNDEHGHAAGDELLREVASRLRACTRETDTVARRGGDEFLILLEDVRGSDAAASVARQILARIVQPCCVEGTVLRPAASIGLAIFRQDASDGESLERLADLAMYAAKRAGGNRVVAFNPLEQTKHRAPLDRAHDSDGSARCARPPAIRSINEQTNQDNHVAANDAHDRHRTI